METKTSSVPVPPIDDLIEVRKPTSLLIAQFFLFPLIIIAICIGIFLLFGYLTYEQKTAQEYLNDVRTGSELCCRWQSAYEISNMWALGSIGDSAPVPDIAKKLEAPDPAVRRTAAYVLGALKDPRAIRDLKIALNDPGQDVQWNAAIALAQLNDASGSELLTKLLDRGYVDKLEGMTSEQKSQLVINAIKCLGILKFQGARDKILALSQSDPDLAVRDASLEALKKF